MTGLVRREVARECWRTATLDEVRIYSSWELGHSVRLPCAQTLPEGKINETWKKLSKWGRKVVRAEFQRSGAPLVGIYTKATLTLTQEKLRCCFGAADGSRVF